MGVHLLPRVEGGWRQEEVAAGVAVPTGTNCVLIHLCLTVPRPHSAAQVLLAQGPRGLLIIVIVTALFHHLAMPMSAYYQLCDLGQISQPL